MTVHDLWYLKKKDADGNRIPSQRHGRGKRWRVSWIDPNTNETVTEHFDKKGDAEDKDKLVGADVLRGQYVDGKAGKILVREYAEKWRQAQRHEVLTREGVERFFRLHVYPEPLANLPVGAVRSSHIQSWVTAKSETMAASTLAIGYIYLKSMFSTLSDDRDIGANPCTRRISLPDIDPPRRYIPSPAEVHRINSEIAENYRPIPLVAAACGLRPAEIYGLERRHVDITKREILVEQQMKRTKDWGCYVGRPKTKTSYRVVEMPDALADAFERHFETHPPVKLRLMDRRDQRVSKHVERDVNLIFTSAAQGPIYNALWSAYWIRAVKRANLKEHIGLHGLRHYFATLLIHNGASVKTVQLALGHATPMTTLNTYIHEWPDITDRTRNLVDSALFQPAEKVGDVWVIADAA